MGIYTQIAVTHSTDTAGNECSKPLFYPYYPKAILESSSYFLENYAYLVHRILIQGCSTVPERKLNGKIELLNYLNHNLMQVQLPGFSGSEGTVK